MVARKQKETERCWEFLIFLSRGMPQQLNFFQLGPTP
jgi:hypothetical protein